MDPNFFVQSTAATTEGNGLEEMIERALAGFINGEDMFVESRSWEEALLNVNRWYGDLIFKKFETVSQLVEAENWAMVKNCLPFCERWDIGPEEMALFFDVVTGASLKTQELAAVGKDAIDQTMAFYNIIGYGEVGHQDEHRCSHFLPYLVKSHARDYLHARNWDVTGYPIDSRKVALQVPEKG